MSYKVKVTDVLVGDEDKRIRIVVEKEEKIENSKVNRKTIIGEGTLIIPNNISKETIKTEIENKAKEIINRYNEAVNLKDELNKLEYNIK